MQSIEPVSSPVRIPQKAPLPCYGLEHNRFDATCQQCPHAVGCVKAMGGRYDKVTLNHVRWDIVPTEFKSIALDMADPELPHMRRLYQECYHTVFDAKPPDSIDRFSEKVAINAQKVPCSVRLFILANMVAQREHEKTVVRCTDKARGTAFKSSMLAGNLAVRRASVYQEMCHNEFGTFTLNSLSVLTEAQDTDDLARIMQQSEVTAATALVRYKIFNGGEAENALYESEELQLAPEWLALEETYLETILIPRSKNKIKGSAAIERHRHAVFQVHCYYKRNLSEQRIAWLARQQIMPESVRKVLSVFNHQPSDFLYERGPVTQPMEFWLQLALCIRHYHCWLYLHQEPSYFTPRRNMTRSS